MASLLLNYRGMTNNDIILINFGSNATNQPALFDAVNRIGGKAFQYDGTWYLAGLQMGVEDVYNRLTGAVGGATPIVIAFTPGNAHLPQAILQGLGVQSQAA